MFLLTDFWSSNKHIFFIVEPVIICTHGNRRGWVTQSLRATSVNLFSDFTIKGKNADNSQMTSLKRFGTALSVKIVPGCCCVHGRMESETVSNRLPNVI